jgi:membrane associated rhomboid family serine protease
MGGLGPAPASLILLALNILASLYGFIAGAAFVRRFVFHVGSVVELRQYYRIVTSSFLHGNAAHLLVNMLTLFFFGPVVERTLGSFGFVVVYFGAILAGAAVSLAVNRSNPNYASIGASDAVSGVVLSFCVFYPFEPLYILFIPIGVPAILYGVLFILLSAQLMERKNRVVAHESHLGGALAGAALTVLMRPDALLGYFR